MWQGFFAVLYILDRCRADHQSPCSNRPDIFPRRYFQAAEVAA
jgi:hypothetical protein